MRIRTGLVESVLRNHSATAEELSIVDWASKRGLFVWLDSYDDDDGVRRDGCQLGIEEIHNGKLFCYMIDLPQDRYRLEQLDHYEQLLRLGLQHEIEKDCLHPWWNQIP